MELEPRPSHENRYALRIMERPVPSLIQEQLDAFTPQSIHARAEGILETCLPEGETVIAIDIGGDSLVASAVTVANGELQHTPLVDLSGVKNGQGYLEALEQVSNLADMQRLTIGLSYAGPKEGTRPLGGVNVPIFMEELASKYDGDLGKISPALTAFDNDAVSGLRRGTLESQLRIDPSNNVIYVINGSGLNTAFLIDGEMLSSESGHLKVDDRLNPHKQQKPCGLFGAQYVCLEAIAGNKAGIEDIWEQQTGQRLSGREIEALYLNGNNLAGELYDNSALVTAHLIAGVAKGLNLNLQDGSTTIVGHGGTFKFPDYGKRIDQILKYNLGSQSPLLMTKDFSQNACLEGAALAAFAKL